MGVLWAVSALVLAAPGWAAEADAPRLPAGGTRLEARPARVVGSAVVRFADLARADAARRALEGALAPLVILQGEETPEGEGEAEPFTPTPRESYAFPVPGLAPLVPSPAPAQSFKGLDDIPRVGTTSIVIPPDVDGAVGPDKILEGLNNNYRIFDKASGTVSSTVSILTFWAATGGSAVFDPKTLYDPVQQRWIAVALSDARSAASSILIGVSQTSDPSGAWNLYRVLGDSTGVNWVDFPCLGFNKNWIAVNVNLFTIASSTGAGSRCLMIDYAQARSGTLAGSFANGTGFCSSPVATFSPTEPTLYVPTHLSSASGTYRLDFITGTSSAPVYNVGLTRSRGTNWTQPAGSILPQAPPLAGGSVCAPACPIETIDAQIRSTPVFRGGSIWYTQTIGLPAGGLTHTAVQWTRLDAATGNVLDGGRVDDATATATNGGLWYAYPHVAVNGMGDAIVCFTQFSSVEYPSSGYAMRLAADAAGTLRDPVIYKAGEDYYHKEFGSGRNRWGDYAKAQVDPSDDVSLWVVTEYAKARTGTDDGDTGSNSSKWGTWWARVGPVVTIGPGPTVAEGDSGITPATVPVALSQPLTMDLTVAYSVSDGTATLADGDYDSPGTSVVIPAGSLAAAIPVNIHGDRKYEGGDETFTVSLVSATGATIGSPAQATVTIHDTDPLPAVSVNDVAAAEGNAGPTPFTFTVSLSNPSFQAISVDYATHDSTATIAGGDYIAASGTVTIPAGALTAPLTVTVNGDVATEPDEIFLVNLSNPVNATIADGQGRGTIVNDDALPALSIAGVTAIEGNSGVKPFKFRLSLSHPSAQPVTAQVSTRDGSATVAGGDYASLNALVTMPPFAVSDSVSVGVNGDILCEPNETFFVALSNITGAVAADTVATGTITNDDECTPPAVTVLSPNGGETLTITTTATLTWTATDASGVTSVDLAVSRDGGATYTPIAAGEANDGSYDWPVIAPAATQALLKVTAHDAAGNTGSDVSNAVWNIAFPSTAVSDEPVVFALGGIVPNPAVNGARVYYGLPLEAHVRLTVADLQGRTLAVLADGVQPAGRHVAVWDGAGPRGTVAAGVYFLRYEAAGRVATRRFAVTH